jgi:cytochrome c
MEAVRMDLSAGEQSYPASAHVARVAIAAQYVHLRYVFSNASHLATALSLREALAREFAYHCS